MTAIELKQQLEKKIFEGTIDPQEPVFMLRGRDRLAPQTVRHWAGNLRWETGPTEKYSSALLLCDEMIRWQSVYGSKVPD